MSGRVGERAYTAAGVGMLLVDPGVQGLVPGVLGVLTNLPGGRGLVRALVPEVDPPDSRPPGRENTRETKITKKRVYMHFGMCSQGSVARLMKLFVAV